MKITQILALSVTAALAVGCSSTIKMPKGKAKGYSSARFVNSREHTVAQGIEDTPEVNKMVQDAISNELRKGGIRVGGGGEDLIIAYMLLHQTVSSTTMNDDHFGYGRDAGEILERAHEAGTIENKSPDYFEAGAVVVDLLDARTNELVFRNFAVRDTTQAPSPSQQRARINNAVAEAIAPFFR